MSLMSWTIVRRPIKMAADEGCLMMSLAPYSLHTVHTGSFSEILHIKYQAFQCEEETVLSIKQLHN